MDQPALPLAEETDAATPRSGDWSPFVVDFVLPFVREPALWPVAIAILGHVVVVIALALLAVARGGAVHDWLALLGTFALFGSPALYEIKLRGRPEALTAALVLTWITGALVAGVTGYYGVF